MLFKIMTVTVLKDLTETNYYELNGNFVDVRHKRYRRGDVEPHFEKVSFKAKDFFNKLFGEIERELKRLPRKCKSSEYIQFYDTALEGYELYQAVMETCKEDLDMIPEVVVNYLNDLDYLNIERLFK